MVAIISKKGPYPAEFLPFFDPFFAILGKNTTYEGHSRYNITNSCTFQKRTTMHDVYFMKL